MSLTIRMSLVDTHDDGTPERVLAKLDRDIALNLDGVSEEDYWNNVEAGLKALRCLDKWFDIDMVGALWYDGACVAFEYSKAKS